jgi:predicted RNA-binding protein with PIN domain
VYYIIDGYNLFFQLSEKNPSIENRQNFVELISTLMKKANLQGEMIFDMPMHHQTMYAHSNEAPPLTIVYAPTALEADDLIVEKLYAIKRPKGYTIVTSDRVLIQKVKEQEANVIGSSAFFSLLQKKNKVCSKNKKPVKDSSSQIDRLEAIFLRRFQDENE